MVTYIGTRFVGLVFNGDVIFMEIKDFNRAHGNLDLFWILDAKIVKNHAGYDVHVVYVNELRRVRPVMKELEV